MSKSVLKIVMSRIGGFLIFLVLLAVANILIPFFANDLYLDIVVFFDFNLLLFFGMMVVGMINDIFWSFYFPFNILAPITGSVLSVLILTFIYRVWVLIDLYVGSGVFIPFTPLCLLVSLIVLLSGYLTIISRQGKPRTVFEEEFRKKEKALRRKKKKSAINWGDVGDEFKLALYNLARLINNLFRSNKRKKSKKK